ncbi:MULTISPECIES: helix-turn-helix transcriptional regulator [Actinosynnema]|uniref:helix-turn-helix domain-containing protein n=1 Tax=Actinosynnema TaxID=40566 RepID=UPI0020A267FC|nr:helix-turn-helix transcriptional regulator [Actinosynnema pretiosum]MCP2092696.1 Helix-turn-helix domain-containing protein [Actinosynnema pretiosum]
MAEKSEDEIVPIRRRHLAIRLRKAREERGLLAEAVAKWAGFSQSTLSRIENAKQRIQVKHVRLLANRYGLEAGELALLLSMAEKSDHRGLLVAHASTIPDFAAAYFDLEQIAVEMWVYEPGVVFGLLQSPEYVRALRQRDQPTATAEELRASVALRQARQDAVVAQRPTIRLVLDEAVLHRLVGSDAVMADQLRRLREVSTDPSMNLTLQILPFAQGGQYGVGMGFTILKFGDSPVMNVVYTEHIQSASYLEAPLDVSRYVDQFNLISESALPPADSRTLLTTLMTDLWNSTD